MKARSMNAFIKKPHPLVRGGVERFSPKSPATEEAGVVSVEGD